MRIADEGGKDRDYQLSSVEFAKLARAIKTHHAKDYHAAIADGVFSLMDAVHILADRRELTQNDVQCQDAKGIKKLPPKTR